MSDEQFEQLKDFLEDKQRDLITMSHQTKDKELSGLHSEILTKLKDMSVKIDSHDAIITETSAILPSLKKVLIVYQGSYLFGKIVAAIVGFVITTSIFIVSIKTVYQFLHK